MRPDQSAWRAAARRRIRGPTMRTTTWVAMILRVGWGAMMRHRLVSRSGLE